MDACPVCGTTVKKNECLDYVDGVPTVRWGEFQCGYSYPRSRYDSDLWSDCHHDTGYRTIAAQRRKAAEALTAFAATLEVDPEMRRALDSMLSNLPLLEEE